MPTPKGVTCRNQHREPIHKTYVLIFDETYTLYIYVYIYKYIEFSLLLFSSHDTRCEYHGQNKIK